jgi:hypothetical protein
MGTKQTGHERNLASLLNRSWWIIVRDLRTCVQKESFPVDVLKELLGEAA